MIPPLIVVVVGGRGKGFPGNEKGVFVGIRAFLNLNLFFFPISRVEILESDAEKLEKKKSFFYFSLCDIFRRRNFSATEYNVSHFSPTTVFE